MKKITLIISIVLLCFSSIAFGYVIGSSNLGIMGYPSFDKMKPFAPISKDSFSMSTYQSDVERYVQDAKEYVESANNDIRRIVEKKEEATQMANDVVRTFNNYVKFGY